MLPGVERCSECGFAYDEAAAPWEGDVQANRRAALVIDDVLPPWQPRAVMIRGSAEALHDAASAHGERLGPIIRIHPTQVISWGLDGTTP